MFKDHADKQYYYAKTFSPRADLIKDNYTLTEEPKDQAIKKAIDYVAQYPVSNVLDLGADWGKYSVYAAKSCPLAQVTALEISENRADDLAHLLVKFMPPNIHQRIKVVTEDAEFMDWGALPDFDLIIASDILEHFMEYQCVWDNMVRKSRFVYTLIPCGRSFSWSEDHLHYFFKADIDKLTADVAVVFLDEVVYNEDNSWYSLLVERT